jgi:hypothetical protein
LRFTGRAFFRAFAASLLLLSACELGSTDALSTDLEERFNQEGIVRRAANLDFRYTRDPGGRDERREDRRASIVVTKSTVYIHKNDKVGLNITPRTRRATAVQRSGDRVRVRIGSGRSEEIWSFVPPDDPAGWTTDIRAVINSAGR